tara:strand:+ start:1273 stop:1566 length:294 start_codon:yes stop_codon:yes gene_type:complete
MTPTNVVSMNFKTEETMTEFLEMYERDSPTLFPDAEMLLIIKTTDTSCMGISVYPNEKARLASSNLAESRTSGELKHLFEENFRLSGDMVVKHVLTK